MQTAIAYVVFAATLISLAEGLSSGLPLPGWTMRAVIIATGAAFPIVLVFAWLFDVSREQATPSDEPPVSSPEPAEIPVIDFEAPATPLIGRTADVEEALRRVATSRLLTITGPGGIGKTRLAQEVARLARGDFTNGACFVALAGVETVAALPGALADALGISLSGRENAARQLLAFLREKQQLLVLDNFEQIVDGAPLLAEMLAVAPAIRLIVTSRRRLRIAGEVVMPIDALTIPAANEPLDTSPAARLFIHIASRNDRRFDAVASAPAIARICEITGGVPLAIELAASSVGVLTCEEIARELEQSHELVVGARRDLPPRHQSLHAAVDASWRVLDADEQRAFRSLSVFRTAFDSDAAAAVARTGLQVLARLVEVSLIYRRAPAGFQVLEVLRQFAEEKLAENAAEAADVRSRHSRYFMTRLSEMECLRDEEVKSRALDELSMHSVDVRVAWLFAVASGAVDDLASATPGLYRMLEARGRSGEGIDLFHRASAAVRELIEADSDKSRSARQALGRMLTREAAFRSDVGEVSEGAVLLDEALALLRADGDRSEIAFALLKQCRIARATGDFSSPVFDECLALYRELGDNTGIAHALNALGTARQSLGDYAEAKRLYEESATLFRRIGLAGEAWPALNNLAGVLKLERNFAVASKILEEELPRAQARNDPRAVSFLLTNLATIASAAGDLAAAGRYLAESVRLSREMGYRSRLAYSLNTLASVHMQAGELQAAAKAYRDALAAAVDAQEGPLVTASLVGIARLHLRVNQPGRAASILSAVEAHPSCDEETRSDARMLLGQLDEHALAEAQPVTNLETAIQSCMAVDFVELPPDGSAIRA